MFYVLPVFSPSRDDLGLVWRLLTHRLLQIKHVHEEEWSYIPVGGPLPLGSQPVTAFGAAANLIHPATGYSIVRSLREAPGLADAMARILQADAPVAETSAAVWDALWPQEKRRQVSILWPQCKYSCESWAHAWCGASDSRIWFPRG